MNDSPGAPTSANAMPHGNIRGDPVILKGFRSLHAFEAVLDGIFRLQEIQEVAGAARGKTRKID